MRLAINIDHIATIRNARGGIFPDPVEAAHIAEQAGAEGIVCHLREDRRHIRDNDVFRLRKEITTKLDLEMAATPEIISIAKRVKPELATLVPEKRKELTTEGGLDVLRNSKLLRKAIAQLHDSGIAVSLFVDPVREQIEESKSIGADMIEIHTGEYADATTSSARKKHLDAIKSIAKFARTLDLGVNAGHGLDYTNIKPIASIKEIEEVSIGHAIIAHAVFVGLEPAVKEMIELMNNRKR
ncbi:MAG: pyridoxine 5'-phosphate synthase [Ignavibacteriae bacterium]|nr:pyridoxine 5'-phosphate synthase [Ignavibacteriota bacterium]